MQFTKISRRERDSRWEGWFSKEEAAKVMAFHRSLPGYEKTPLLSLSTLSEEVGLEALYVKDESRRFGLNAFKALGGSYAVARCLGERFSLEPDYAALKRASEEGRFRDLCVITATDGNHGRGVAWIAKLLGIDSVVYMPKGSSLQRLENIRGEGAKAEITEWNYDDTVRFAAKEAEEHGWLFVQDTAWEGYEDIPGWIMQGYMTLVTEAAEDLPAPPSHVFLQAGVGAMAGAVSAALAATYGEDCPRIFLVEPQKADCLFRSAKAADGERHFVTGDMDTIMAGLACGEPCTIAWEQLEALAEGAFSVEEITTATGMRLLAHPHGGDPAIVSGESGAVGLGLVYRLMTEEGLAALRAQAGLDAASRVLCISTEGDTDPEHYLRIVQEGEDPEE